MSGKNAQTATDDKTVDNPETTKTEDPALQDDTVIPFADVLDPDEQSLQEAKALVEAEAQAAEGDDGDGDDVGTGAADAGQDDPARPADADKTANAGQGDQPGKGEDGTKGGDMPTVPLARFQEVYSEAANLREQNAYLKGQAEAYAAVGTRQPSQAGDQSGQDTGQTVTPPSPEERITTARQSILDAAKQYDESEITQAEYAKIQLDQEDLIFQARQEIAGANQQSQQSQTRPQEAVSDQLIMEQHAKDLEAGHPFLHVLSENDVQKTLVPMAYAEAEREGKPIPSGNRGTMELQSRVARLADVFGPMWYPDAAGAAGAGGANDQTNPQQPGAGAQQPQDGLSPRAKNTLKKIEAAQNAPPDTSRLGQTGENADMTGEQYMALSEEEREALPESVRQKILQTASP